ncbi:hypothetical protein KJS94_17315 [Flavihumibacter rivuli]|uniref:hypothetical protein n=1 Tax=Flavihumibacter rivuli TaxID=2838156 RepID=UPI001BDEB70A|nr:hypothetical protein [Flavihumibacter rivuli]ULQ56413.1 hypothetical protein KJS94_17315 [Flavihumibacter rivuli]
MLKIFRNLAILFVSFWTMVTGMLFTALVNWAFDLSLPTSSVLIYGGIGGILFIGFPLLLIAVLLLNRFRKVLQHRMNLLWVIRDLVWLRRI